MRFDSFEAGSRFKQELSAITPTGKVPVLLAEHGGPLLFGDFTVADAYFAPVCMRFKTYALPLPPAITAYVERVCALPGVKAWTDQARAEKDFLDFEEPYRLAR